MKLIITLLALALVTGLVFAYFYYSEYYYGNRINSGIIAKAATKSAAMRGFAHEKGASNSKVASAHFTSALDVRMQQEINKDMRDKIAKMKPSKNILLAELKLPSDKQRLAKQLLAEYEFVGENTFLNMRKNGNANLTRAQVQDQIEVNRQEIMNNFKELLTDDQFTFLEYYLKTEPYRGDGGRLAGNMEKDTAVKLTPENREALIGMLADGTEALRIATHGYTTVNDLEKNKYMRQYFIENAAPS